MNKKVDEKVGRISKKHVIASSAEELFERKGEICDIYIEAGPKRFRVPSQYHSLFFPAIETMKELSHDALMNELKAQEEYDG